MDEKTANKITARMLSDKTPMVDDILVNQAWMLVAALQLAALHPALRSATAGRISRVADLYLNAIYRRHPLARKTGPTLALMADESPLTITMRISDAWMIVSAIQLTMRHTEVDDDLRGRLTALARKYQAALATVHPAAGELLEMGWDTKYDVEAGT